MLKRFVLAALFSLGVCTASAQILPSGSFTPGHTIRCQNAGCTVSVDAGGAAGSQLNGQGYLPELGITNTGTPFCVTDALTNASGGYHQFCVGANALGGGLISYNAYGGASPLPLQFDINGTVYLFPGPGGGTVLGPVTTTPSSIPVWNNSGGTLLKDGVAAFPSSFGSTPTDYASINIGGFPLASQIGGGALEAIVGKVVVPNSYTQAPQPNSALAGYIENNNSANGNSAVSVYGFAQINTDGASPYGGNFTVQNYRGPYTTNGHDYGVAIGLELDTSIGLKAGSVTPAGTSYGIYQAGFSNVKPTGGAIAQYLLPFGTGIPWDRGWQSVDGAATTSLMIGASGSGNNVGGQPIQFTSRTAGAVTNFSSINVDTVGGFNLGINGTNVFNVEPGSAAFAAPLVVGSTSQSGGTGSFLAHQGTNSNLQIQGPVDLADGVSVVSQVDALNANKGLELIATTIELKPSVGLNINGTAAVSCAVNTPAHLTVVDGIVTVCN